MKIACVGDNCIDFYDETGMACPGGNPVNVAVYAQLHNKDYAYAVETVILSTLFSIVTIPALVALTGLIW